MPQKNQFWAVAKGREVGIYSSWESAKAQVDRYPGAVHKGFNDIHKAANFVQGGSYEAQWQKPGGSNQGYVEQKPYQSNAYQQPYQPQSYQQAYQPQNYYQAPYQGGSGYQNYPNQGYQQQQQPHWR